jgi:hypothetical protein
MRKFSTTSATIKGTSNGQEIPVLDVRRVTGRLNLCDHEVVFRGHCFHLSLLLSCLLDFISDLTQIHIQVLMTFLTSTYSWIVIISQSECLSEAMRATFNYKLLLNSKSYMSQSNIASGIVHMNISFTFFMGFKCISFKGNFNFRCTLVHATPCSDLMFTALFDTSFSNRWDFS